MPHAGEEGFTLLEVLVALIASTLLLGSVLNAAVQAKSRIVKAEQDERATLLAGSLIEERAARPFEAVDANGTSGRLTWQSREQAITVDPRQQFVLAEIEVSVFDSTDTRLARLKIRKLKLASAP